MQRLATCGLNTHLKFLPNKVQLHIHEETVNLGDKSKDHIGALRTLTSTFCNERQAKTRGKEIIYPEHRGWEIEEIIATKSEGTFGKPCSRTEMAGAGKPGYMNKARFFATKSKANTKAAWSKVMMMIRGSAGTLTAAGVVNSIPWGYLRKNFLSH